MKLAVINEEKCVGCGKCLNPCPVDAIVGAPQFMHSVLTHECIGCGLCVAPCPMNCIEMVSNDTYTQENFENHVQDKVQIQNKQALAENTKRRYLAKKARLSLESFPQLPQFKDKHAREKIVNEIQAAVARRESNLTQRSSQNKINEEEWNQS